MALLESFQSFEILKEECLKRHIVVKEYNWNDLAVLSYHHIKSDSRDPLVQECRGVVIDKTTMRIVCRPFNKFENYVPENHAKTLEGKKYEFRAKLDGTLLKVFYYNDKWWFGTRTEIDAFGVNRDSGFSFISLVLLSLGLESIKQLQSWCDIYLDKESTHLFEIISQYNRVVIDYEATQLYYLGSVKTETGHHYNIPYGTFPRAVRRPVVLPDDYTAEGMLDDLNTSNNSHIEGYVLYIDDVPTYKFKSRLYVVHSLLRNNGGLSLDDKLIKRYLSTIVCISEINEWCASFPEHRDLLKEIDKLFNHNVTYITNKIMDAFIEHHETKDFGTTSFRKLIGLATKGCPINGVLFHACSELYSEFITQFDNEDFTDEDVRKSLYTYLENMVRTAICEVSGRHQEEFIFWNP